MTADTPHLPQPAQIESYGNGGFRFGGMSHRGSVLCLPQGVWAWPVTDMASLGEDAVAAVLERAAGLDFFILGTGADMAAVPTRAREAFRAAGLRLDAMATGAAVRTYNILLGEKRAVGAGLIAVDAAPR